MIDDEAAEAQRADAPAVECESACIKCGGPGPFRSFLMYCVGCLDAMREKLEIDAAEGSALIEPPRRQEKVAAWVQRVFEGDAVAVAGPERTFRFVEEAVELAQAVGLPPDGLKRLVDYVYERPAGEPRQEVGGCFVTLYAACWALGVDGDLEADKELARVQDPAIVERVRGRQAEKRAILK